jgi:hypothetical protein
LLGRGRDATIQQNVSSNRRANHTIFSIKYSKFELAYFSIL